MDQINLQFNSFQVDYCLLFVTFRPSLLFVFNLIYFNLAKFGVNAVESYGLT